MSEKSWWWSTGAATGDSPTNYTQVDLSEISKILAACNGFEGVAPGYLNSLAITGATSPISMDTGAALVDGRQYKNDAALSITIPTPVTYSRIDRIVLRASWGTTYTVRAYRIAGTEAASPVAPAITQNSGTTYDIKLYQVLITTGGVITLTDERVFAQVQTAGIANLAVTAAKMATPAAWTLVTYQNGWSDFGFESPVSYYKDLLGIVHLRGVCGGTTLSVIFTLPVGYRPPYNAYFIATDASGTNIQRIKIFPDGSVYAMNGASAYFWGLDGISFQAA